MAAQISISELDRLAETGAQVTYVDVRSVSEFDSGHVPGALNIPLDQIEARIADLSPGPIVLFCQAGSRAEMACTFLQTSRPDAQFFEGGFDAWVESGRDYVVSKSTRWSLDRQVRLGAGLIVLIGMALGFTVHPGWFGLAAFVGAGLTFAGLTNVCGMAALLGKMPWNQPKAPSGAMVACQGEK